MGALVGALVGNDVGGLEGAFVGFLTGGCLGGLLGAALVASGESKLGITVGAWVAKLTVCNAVGINGVQGNNGASFSGAVYVYPETDPL